MPIDDGVLMWSVPEELRRLPESAKSKEISEALVRRKLWGLHLGEGFRPGYVDRNPC
jgi:hypothetical protein